jgi:hypothetical protein
VPDEIIAILRELNAEIIRYRGEIGWKLMMHRFLPIESPLVEIMLSRDTDSRIGERERACVKEFEESGFLFHTMHDHPYHNLPILGGMFAVKKGIIDNIFELISQNINRYENKYQCDQMFLQDIVYPIVKDNMLVHQDIAFYGHEGFKKMPTERNNFEFVGAVYDQNDQRFEDFHTILKNYLQQLNIKNDHSNQ